MIALVAPVRAAVAALLVVALSGLPAAAADGRAGSGVELSRDRVAWGRDLDEPLFLPGLAWAAGDVRASTFFVRNDSDATADIEVTLTRRPPPEPATDQGVTVSAVAGAGSDTSVPADGEPHVVTVADLAPGDVAPVTVRAEVRADVPSGTEADPGSIAFRAAVAGATDPEDDWVGILSAAHLALAPVFLGLALVLATLAGRRRTRARGRPR